VWKLSLRMEVSNLETDYREFELTLGNGDTCRVRYCDRWGKPMFGNRTVHFEFLDCLSVSETGYRSEFRIVPEREQVDPVEAAKQLIEALTGIPFSGENMQQKLF
jgi:hypothetical protein